MIPAVPRGAVAKTSPTARTLAKLREEGWTAQVVEKWNQFAMKRIDLLGFIDIIAIKLDHPVLGVQATTGDHVADHIRKIESIEASMLWRSVAALEVWGWRKVGPRGTRKVWECRRVRL
jgi:hypothetical protein